MNKVNPISINKKTPSEKGHYRLAFGELQTLLDSYFKKYPHVSLNGLAKMCQVSEPTLRRIKKGQTKTLPTITTVFELLSYITKIKESDQLIEFLGEGALSQYLKEKLPQLNASKDLVISEDLTQSLKDPIKYLIFKLATHDKGVQREKLIELFGIYGDKQINQLISEDLIYLEKDSYKTHIKYFALSNEVFIDHFKTTADFIKPQKHASANRKYSPIFSNYSSSVNKKGYSEILKAQRLANKKIAAILTSETYKGSIPTFALNAVDTLDILCADEFQEE